MMTTVCKLSNTVQHKKVFFLYSICVIQKLWQSMGNTSDVF